MKKITAIIVLFLGLLPCYSQQLTFDTELDFFFDNTEFAQSSYTIDQTMAGVNLGQFIGWTFDNNHQLMGGVEVNKYLGTQDIIDDTHIMAYYQYQDNKTLFKAGSFKRDGLLDDYSNVFFQDSIRYYQRTMDGLYVQRSNDKAYLKLWLDWNGLQTEDNRETFYMGLSGYQRLKNNFYMDFQSYMYHYAGTRPSNPDINVCDNFLIKTGLGYQFSKDFLAYKLSVGVLAGYEKNRAQMADAYKPLGFLAELNARYRWLGTENLIYAGDKRMALYESLGGSFYWGNPFLRGNFYWQNKVFAQVFDSENVQGQLAFRQHLSEGHFHFEQMFTLSVTIAK